RQFDTAIDDRGDQPVVVVGGSAGSATFEVVRRFTEPIAEVAAGSTTAGMPGTIVAVPVAVGDAVGPGTPLVVMEAMKMELVVEAVVDGVVTAVPVAVGDAVEAGQVLVVIEADEISEG
ncbi:MAG: biotin/lipoyl-binding protein, partial [Acidimicrobiales bacterium]|nr:biotin/lipoyl-binding protein [Acidimicrobiales bacterium]